MSPRTAALMQPAVSLFYRCSPASIALASRHPVPVTSLAGRFPHEAWASFAQEGSYFQGNRIAKSTACFVHPVGLDPNRIFRALPSVIFVAAAFHLR
jgi:hypothetical protein